MSLALAQPQLDAIADACRQHQVLRMHLFGSALRDDFDPTRSDIEASKQLIYEACPAGLDDYSRSRQISCTNGSLTP
jgi:N-acyl-D-aspartate/D-glutamate deacylase